MELQPMLVDDRVRTLLRMNELPTADLDDVSVFLYGAFNGPTLLGVVGLQVLDGIGLLRSLAVDPAHRARGLGARLCDLVETEARARALDALWLLTIAARDYSRVAGSRSCLASTLLPR